MIKRKRVVLFLKRFIKDVIVHVCVCLTYFRLNCCNFMIMSQFGHYFLQSSVYVYTHCYFTDHCRKFEHNCTSLMRSLSLHRWHIVICGAGPRHVGAPGRLIIWCPFKPIFFKRFFNIYFSGAGEKLIFNKHLHFACYVRSYVWEPELTGTIFPILSSDILAPLIGLRPGQLPDCPAP
jgi:hypothetical protein